MKTLSPFILLLSLFAGCGGAASPRVEAIVALSTDVQAGKPLYEAKCQVCHGANGAGTSLGPDIRSKENNTDNVEIIVEGGGDMPAFATMSDQEIADTNAYANSL